MTSDKHVITIEVDAGVVIDVTGLPEGWTYRILDYDAQIECDLCHQSVNSVGGELFFGPDDSWVCPVCLAEEVIECRYCHRSKWVHGPNGENLLGQPCPYCKQPTPELATTPTGPVPPPTSGPSGD